METPKLYSFSISPSCQRVFATFANKGVDYERVEIDIGVSERPDSFERISPFGKVPVLEHKGQVILESANIVQYINDTWPEPPMMPADPAGRAYARQWIQYADREIFDRDAQFVHVERDHQRKLQLCADLLNQLGHLDRALDGKTSLFLGDSLSLVDCMLAPSLANAPVWSELTGDKKFATYSNIRNYTDRLRANPVLSETVFSVPIEVYQGFFSAVLVEGMTFPPEQ